MSNEPIFDQVVQAFGDPSSEESNEEYDLASQYYEDARASLQELATAAYR